MSPGTELQQATRNIVVSFFFLLEKGKTDAKPETVVGHRVKA
jgi:hypothetical protein